MTRDRTYNSTIGVRRKVIEMLNELSDTFGQHKGEIVQVLVEALYKALKDTQIKKMQKYAEKGDVTGFLKLDWIWSIEPVTKKILIGPDNRNTGSKTVHMNAPETSVEEIEKGFEK